MPAIIANPNYVIWLNYTVATLRLVCVTYVIVERLGCNVRPHDMRLMY